MLRDERDTVQSGIQELVLDNFLPYRLNILAEIVSHSLAEVYSRQYDIVIPEWRVLANLGQRGKLSAKQIGERAHMNKTKVSRAAAALEQSGLIMRNTDNNDKRSAILSLTGKGRDIYNRIVPVAIDFANELESALDPEDLRAFDQMLLKLKRKSEELAISLNRETD